MEKSKVNKFQVKVMESIGFVYNSFDSSAYGAQWEYDLYKTKEEKYRHIRRIYPDLGEKHIKLEEIISNLADFYYKSGENSIIYPMRKLLKIKNDN